MASAQEVANVAGIVNQSALGWYSTITGKPIQSGVPSSWLQSAVGADFRGGPTAIGQTAAPLSLIIVVALVVLGGVLVVRKL